MAIYWGGEKISLMKVLRHFLFMATLIAIVAIATYVLKVADRRLPEAASHLQEVKDENSKKAQE